MNNYTGMYLGIVVQNNDPEKRGRVKVYVPHVSAGVYENWYQQDVDKKFSFPGSNIDTDLSTVIEPLKSVLPWAEPAMPLVGASGSGRYNSHLDQASVSDTSNLKTAVSGNQDFDTASKYNLNDTGIGESPGRKYEFESMRLNDAFTTSLSGSKNAPNKINRYSYQYKPTTYSNQAKGSFSIPNVGSHLWLFFESGDHMRPVYFASSTGKEDWDGIYNYNESSDYPSIYENVSKEDLEHYDSDTETYRNKYVINQKAGALEFVNTDNREILKFTHFSGSFKEFNNHVNIELATQNDQKLVIEDQFYTVQGFKNLYTGRDLDNIIKGDSYKKIGNLDSDIHQQWKDLAKNIHDIKAQFDTLRIEQSGTFAPCPVCADPLRMDKIHSVNAYMTRHNASTWNAADNIAAYAVRVAGKNEITDSLKSGINIVNRYVVENKFSQSTGFRGGGAGTIFGAPCPVCGGSGVSPSTMNGTWDINQNKGQTFNDAYMLGIEKLFEVEKHLGHGGSELIEIAKHKSETIGLVMNDFASTRIDPVGKIYRDKLVVHPEGVLNSQKPSPLVEHVHVDDLPGGTYTMNVCNRWNVQVGSGGVSVKTTGTVDVGGTITNIGGEQVNIGSANEVNIDGGSRLSLIADIISIRQRNRDQVLVDSNLGVSQNVIVGGGMHVEGELTVNHVTAPAEIQETDPVVIFGQLLKGLTFQCNINGGTHVDAAHSGDNHPNWTGTTITVIAHSNDDKVRMYPHTHHFKNLPLNLKENNDEVRKDAMDNNAGTRRDAKPMESKTWNEKMYNTNMSNVKSTDTSSLDTPHDFKGKSCGSDNWCS